MRKYKTGNVLLAIFTAILAFMGALGGSFLTGYLNKNLWERQNVYEQKKQIFDQRIKLIERISRIVNLSPQMLHYQSYVQLQSSLMNEYIACTKKPSRACNKPDDPKTVLEISNKQTDLNAEFSSAVQLVSMYFGEKTKVAATELSQKHPWWEIGEPSFRQLLRTMNDELYYFEPQGSISSNKERNITVELKDIIYGFGILLTFIVGAWNLFNNYKISRKTTFINTVTAERVKWIEQLRQDISSFSGLTHTWCFSELEGKPDENEILKEVDRLRHVIRLRLNPEGEHDQKIEVLIQKIPKLTHISNREELQQALEDLTVTTQKLLKDEWEKVKKEAKEGDLEKDA